MAQLTLHNYWRSSSSHRVRIALALKGLEYRYAVVNILAEEHTSEPHRARSPTGYVPCLEIDGVPYVESVAIVELLEELYPEPALFPKDSRGRARVRALVEIVNSGIQPLQNRHVTEFRSKDHSVQRDWLQHFVSRGMAALEAAIEMGEREGVAGPFAYGESPTAADAFLVPQVFSAQRFHVDLAGCRRVRRAFEAAMKLDAFRRAAPDEQPDAVKKGRPEGV